jgi:hypothetical protein
MNGEGVEKILLHALGDKHRYGLLRRASGTASSSLRSGKEAVMNRFPAAHLRRLLLCCLVVLSALPVTPALAATTRYVATSGSDSNAGTSSAPYRTIQKCASVSASGDTCSIRSGTYRETVTPNAGVIFKPDTGATVTVSGADPVSGWTQDNGNIYRATVTIASGLDANQVFVNDTMVFLARWPNMAPDATPMDLAWATADAGTQQGRIADAELPNVNWTGATIRIWGGYNPFIHQTAQVTSSSQGQVAFSTSDTNWQFSKGNKYYLVNKREALDAPGEWYYDASTRTLYLWAPAGGTPSNVTVKQREWAFDLRDRSNVTIQGIKLFAAGIITNGSSQNNTVDGITATYLSHFDFFGGNYKAFTKDTGIVLDGTGNTVKNSTLVYSAGSGVSIVGDGNTVTNNLIHDVGYGGTYATAVIVAPNRSSATITYNTIYNTGRDGINLDYDDVQGNDTHKNHNIGYNRIYRYSLWAEDSGGIDACCHLDASGSKIHHNWVYEFGRNNAEGPVYQLPSPIGAGIYLDNNAGGFEVYQNVLWRNRTAGIYLHHIDTAAIVPNAVYNNTIYGNQTDGTRADQALGVFVCDTLNLGGTRIENNAVPNNPATPCVSGGTSSGVTYSNNSPTATGANEGINATVGCNFSGCGGDSPPSSITPTRSAFRPIEGESFDEGSGVRPILGYLGYAQGGNWARYKSVDFGAGVSTVYMRVAVPPEYAGGKIQVRLDSMNGTQIGSLTVTNTGSFEDTFQVQQTGVSSVTGVHDVYLVFSGTVAGNVDWFQFTSGGRPANGLYRLTARHSSKVLDVSARSKANGAAVHQWDWYGHDNQQWLIEAIADGVYRVMAKHSGKALDVSGASLQDYAPVHQWTWYGNTNQQWRIDTAGSGYVWLTAVHSQKRLDVSGYSQANGAIVQQYAPHNGENQQWKLDPAP